MSRACGRITAAAHSTPKPTRVRRSQRRVSGPRRRVGGRDGVDTEGAGARVVTVCPHGSSEKERDVVRSRPLRGVAQIVVRRRRGRAAHGKGAHLEGRTTRVLSKADSRSSRRPRIRTAWCLSRVHERCVTAVPATFFWSGFSWSGRSPQRGRATETRDRHPEQDRGERSAVLRQYDGVDDRCPAEKLAAFGLPHGVTTRGSAASCRVARRARGCGRRSRPA